MPEILEERRESWGTRGGFILAAIGSAIGLGNLWAFPYKLYSYGGGAFLIPYMIALFVVGIPLLTLEFSLGHWTQRAAPEAFKYGHRRFEIVGWWSIILSSIIVTYYPVILAYCFSFLGYSIVGIFNGGDLPWAGEGIEGVAKAKSFFFETYLGYQDGPQLGGIRYNLILPLLVSWLAMYFCIFKGVKLISKIVWLTVPLPWLMLVILAVRGLTLEGSMQGLAYYLDPVWSQLAKPITWRYAFGQVFFSMTVAFGVMITYASFLHRKSDINNNAAVIGLADFGTSFVAGIAVFATLGAMAFSTQQAGSAVPVENIAEQGPSLAFVAFPYALAQLPYSAWFSFIFFFALVTLGVDSAFSMTEAVVASVVDKTGWSRAAVLITTSVTGLLFGLVYITRGGLNWIGTIDGFVNGTFGIAFLGLLECVALGWLWRVGMLRRHANSRSDWSLGKWWDYLIRLVVPLVLGTLFLWQLFDDLGAESGFLRTPDGQWKVETCVGLGVLLLAPVLAITLSLVRGRGDVKEVQCPDQNLSVGGGASGAIALTLALVPAAACLILYAVMGPALMEKITLWPLLAAGILAIVLSNYILEKHNTDTTRASWFAKWAGVAGTMDVSAFIAARLTRLAEVESPAGPVIREGLSGVSYVILGLVILIVVFGLGWCFYRALTASGRRGPVGVEADRQQTMDI